MKDEQIERLKESEEKYRQMIDMASDAILTVDYECATIIETNSKTVNMTGYTREELVGKSVWDLHPAKEKDQAVKIYKDVTSGRSVCCTEMHFLRKDGSLLQIEVTASVIHYGEKKAIQRICRDITSRKKLEQENAFLRKYYESIFNMMPIGLGVRKDIDKKPIVEFENDFIMRMFERAKEDGCDCCWNQAETDSICHKAVINANGVYAEERMFPNERIYQFTSSYFRDPENLWRELNIVQDVTEARRLQAEIHKANEELEERVEERTRELKEKQAQLVQSEKMASLGSLVAGVAHEINTPLGALKNNYYLFVKSIEKIKKYLADPGIPESLKKDENLQKLLDSIDKLNVVNETATERIINIVKSLRNFARLDQAEMDTVDIHEGLESTLTLIKHEFKNRIEVRKDLGKIPRIKCLPNQVNQVFMNLLVNALHAIEDKGLITIKTYRQDDNIIIEIADNGKGIPEHIREKIFDPGFTTKGAGVGTGLGLSIVHQIINAHKGQITFESTEGKGTTFKIALPID